MNTAFDSLTHKMQRAALGKTVDLVLSHAEKDPAKTVGQIVIFQSSSTAIPSARRPTHTPSRP